MVRVSEFYDLGQSQPTLEFLDVDVVDDTPVFVDPSALRHWDDPWAEECVALLQDFYDEVMTAIRVGDRPRGIYLLSNLGESDEAHLGLSQGASDGSGVAIGLAERIFDALAENEIVQNGHVHDLEETVLFVPGIGHDRISDITINIIRSQLILFTQRICAEHEIPLVSGLSSGPMWDRQSHSWVAKQTNLPMPKGKLLLVPKGIVRKNTTFDAGEYLNHFVLPYLQEVELASSTSNLIKKRSKRLNYERYVTKKSIRERDGKPTKPWNSEVTDKDPSLLAEYRESKSKETEPPSHDDIAAVTGTTSPDWTALLNAVLAVPPGPENADTYHREVQKLLVALFYPALDHPRREYAIHEGRKRIDIAFVNVAQTGFFWWLDTHGQVPAGNVFVECKNYSAAIGNKEFDQLAGRFSPRRGKFGLLCFRGFADKKEKIVKQCRDFALDDRGIIIALDDADLAALVQSRIDGNLTLFAYLKSRYDELI